MLRVEVRRVLLVQHRVDFRKGFDGLLGVAYQLGADPFRGDCVVFVRKDHTQVRMLVGDTHGLYLVCRRFHGGRLQAVLRFAEDPSATTISQEHLLLLLGGTLLRARATRGMTSR